MSTFFSTGLNRKIDALMDRLFGAGVASHATIIEQINYLMFLRALTTHDDEAKLLNPNHEEVFKGELAKYRWDNLLILNSEVLFDTLDEAYQKLPDLTSDKIVSLLFRNAHIKIYDKPALRTLVHEIEKLVTELDEAARHGSKDIFGDMYEYLLSKLAQAGTNGQFRTPRHIIRLIVDLVDPEKGQTILDPACGTAGFLVAALDHLKYKYSSERFIKDGAFPMDKLIGNERDFIFNHAFTGFDSDEDMVKFGVMNLYLHNLSNASIKRQNTLIDTAGDRTKWDVILANPPFAGKIDKDSISEDIKMGTNSTELLFMRFIMDHLEQNGHAGVIVPDGVLFGRTSAHKTIRQKLIEDMNLKAVISLPPGVFLPYADASTNILIFSRAKSDSKVWFRSIQNDGFTLDDKRSAIDGSEIQDIVDEYREVKPTQGISVSVQDIIANDYQLSEGDYKDNFLDKVKHLPNNWSMISLDNLVSEVNSRSNGHDAPVLSITKNQGFVESTKYFTKQTYSKDLSKYKLVHRNDFAYSAIHIDEGSIGLLMDFDEGLISPMYKVFKIKDEKLSEVNPVYLMCLLKSDKYIEIYKNIGKGSIKRRKSISFKEFSKIKILLPSIATQNKIADQYTAITRHRRLLLDEEIKLRLDINDVLDQVN